ncbi:Inorganic pyrophosphatase [Candidatus Erwinia haradaeae]|uniref:Inorganic pyrophosphatase n=1 Tax=Candidatus Erwinia haradaeae TaxID=1922217 RepID=A0A451DC55_9GAMM|nr:inorganic diphosphatase [Candidatus Erwinia haradaeae]VFP84000.1 Inorganic pyrophosphatase [Candidatus Erwinia haradaeae]
MSLKYVPTGYHVPDDIYVIIEIPSYSHPIKYEVDKETGVLFVDRFIATTMFYPCNYGYMNKTLSEDGDPLDALVPTPYPLRPGVVIRCRPVGLIKMTDESGPDAKIIAVPVTQVTQEYEAIRDIQDLPMLLRSQIQHFFEQYKVLEKGKWVEVSSWEGAVSAKEEIISCSRRFQEGKVVDGNAT